LGRHGSVERVALRADRVSSHQERKPLGIVHVKPTFIAKVLRCQMDAVPTVALGIMSFAMIKTNATLVKRIRAI
jgi:hypothetical protein